MAPGSYRIYAWDTVNPNAVMYDPEFLRPYDGAAQLVEVASSDKKNLDVKLTLNQQSQ